MFIEELKTEECFELLTAKRVGRLACTHENQPYIVPFHFAFDGDKYLYAFSALGQKIEWMRSNPLVCVEVDDMKNQFEWTSLVAFGRYEELPDTPEFEADRNHAYELLSCRPMWWQPMYVPRTYRAPLVDDKPIYFCILIDKITGHRAVADEPTFKSNVVEKNVPKTQQPWILRFWKSKNLGNIHINQRKDGQILTKH